MTTKLAENAEQKIVFVRGSGPGDSSGSYYGPKGSRRFLHLTARGEKSDFKMYAIYADGTGLTRLTKTTASGYGLTNRSSDGGEATIDWTADGKYVLEVEWPIGCSPDGTKMAFRRGGDFVKASYVYDVYVINTDGTGLTRLTPKNADISDLDGAPMFSPDGTKIAFVNKHLTPSGFYEHEVYVANTDGTGLTRLTNGDMVAWVRAKNE